MIEQALKVIASFKDEASAGLKKLQTQIDSIGKNKSPLGGLADSKAAASVEKTSEAVKKLNAESSKAASGGVASLSKAFGSIKADFAGILSGSSSLGDALGGVVQQGAATATAALTGFGAAAGSAAGALSAAAKSSTQSADVITRALEVFKSAKLDPNKTNDTQINASNRAVYQFATSLGFSRKEATAFRNEINNIANAAEKTATPLKSLRALLSGEAFGGGARAKTLSASVFASLGAAAGTAAVGIATAGTLIVGAVGGISVALNAAADDAAEFADKLGISVDRLKALKLIANETGTSVEGIQKSFDNLTKVMSKTDENSDRAAKSLTNLGLNFEDIKTVMAGPNGVNEAAGLILQRYDALGKTSEATAAVQVLLGSSFRDSSLGIKAAATEFNKYADRVSEYGAGDSKILTQQGADQEVAFNNLGLALAGVGQQLAENVGPAITLIVQAFADTINALRKTEIAGKLVQLVFGTLKLLIFDLGSLVKGLAVTLVALFNGDFKGAADIAKQTFVEAFDAVANFGKQTEVAKESVKGLSQAEAEAEVAAKKAADARKKAAEDQLKLFSDAKEDLQRRVALIGKETELEATLYEIINGKYKLLNQAQKSELAGLAATIDLKKQKIALDEKTKTIQSGLDDKAREVLLGEEELKLAGLTGAEREKQLFILKEMNDLRFVGTGIEGETRDRLEEQIQSLGKRKGALIEAQAAEAERGRIIADSEAVISASVQKNIQLAAQELAARNITQADYVRYVESQVKRVTDLNKTAAEEVSEFWKSAAQGIQGSLQTFFFDFMQGKLGSMVDGVKRAIDQVVSNFLAAQLAAQLFGNEIGKTGKVGGLIGQAGSFLSSVFGGARAEGGPIEAGKTYLVGEKGPELRTFGAAGNITSNDKLQSLGKNVNVSFRVDAIDASSFRSKIDEFKREISAAVNDSNISYGV